MHEWVRRGGRSARRRQLDTRCRRPSCGRLPPGHSPVHSGQDIMVSASHRNPCPGLLGDCSATARRDERPSWRGGCPRSANSARGCTLCAATRAAAGRSVMHRGQRACGSAPRRASRPAGRAIWNLVSIMGINIPVGPRQRPARPADPQPGEGVKMSGRLALGTPLFPQWRHTHSLGTAWQRSSPPPFREREQQAINST